MYCLSVLYPPPGRRQRNLFCTGLSKSRRGNDQVSFEKIHRNCAPGTGSLRQSSPVIRSIGIGRFIPNPKSNTRTLYMMLNFEKFILMGAELLQMILNISAKKFRQVGGHLIVGTDTRVC